MKIVIDNFIECAYALNLANHPYETSAFNLLESKAMTKTGSQIVEQTYSKRQ